ncbi:MAG: hypothetical protein OEQ53_22905, partial [Saprospiraceae bacterium]|nr:hypothetical protein [Saprospiraceae bacterium]
QRKIDIKIFRDSVVNQLDHYIEYFENKASNEFYSLTKEEINSKDYAQIVEMLTNFRDEFDSDIKFVKGQISLNDRIYFLEPERRIRLGLAWSVFTNDEIARLSSLGPWLISIGQQLKQLPIGVIDALSELKNADKDSDHKNNSISLSKTHDRPSEWEDLNRAQLMLIAVYKEFKEFCETGELCGINKDYKFPPLIQLIDGAPTSIWAADRDDVPSLIVINRQNARHNDQETRMQAYASLPHEFGHDIADTFQGDQLLEELRSKIHQDKQIAKPYLWNAWMSEIFADAVGVAGLGVISINGLSRMLKNEDRPPDLIYRSSMEDDQPTELEIKEPSEDAERDDEYKVYEQCYDRHPVSCIRILLAIAIFRELGGKKDLLTELENIWRKQLNKFDTFKDEVLRITIPREDLITYFAEDSKNEPRDTINLVAKTILNTPLDILKGKHLKTLFETIYGQKLFKRLSEKFKHLISLDKNQVSVESPTKPGPSIN